MPPKLEHRAVAPFLDALRVLLRGRQHKNALRYADLVAARDQPPPEVPGGPFHKTSKIYYYTRDARREVEPPLVVVTTKQIASGSAAGELKAVTPNKVYLP